MLDLYILLGAALCAMRSEVFALRLPSRAQTIPRLPLRSYSGQGFKTRPISNAAASSNDAGSTSFLANHADNIYLVNVTLGGSEFTLQLDTGSTDLVLVPDKPVATTTVLDHLQPNSTYGKGFFAGPIAYAKLEFGNYSVDSQVYLNGTSEDFFDEAFFPLGIRGIMGIALDTAPSQILETLVEVYTPEDAIAMGRSVLGNVFLQNPELDNFTTIFLGRTEDGEGTGEGIFTIGEYVEGKDDLKDAKSIDVFSPGRWGIPLDAVSVNERSIALNSTVKGAPSGKAIAVIDSGTSQADLPEYLFNAMVGAFDWAVYDDGMGMWIVPCLVGAPNITFTFGGQDYYIHPLDLTTTETAVFSGVNYTFCTPAFDILDEEDDLDMILGDIFMRNVYSGFDYGSFTTKDKTIKSPSIKFVSLSSRNVSYSDYLSRRNATLASLPPQITKSQLQSFGDDDDAESLSSSSAATTSSDDLSYQALTSRLDVFSAVVTGLLGAILVTLIGLLVVGITTCIRRNRTVGASRNAGTSYAAVPLRAGYKDEE